MKKLSSRTALLLCQGAKATGTFTESVDYQMENWYLDDFDEIDIFARWVDEEIGGAAIGNIKQLFLAFKYPHVKIYKKFADELKETIAGIKRMVS